MNTADLIAARRKAEDAVADMADGPLKVKAFEIILATLLGGPAAEQAEGGVPRVTEEAAPRPTSSLNSRIALLADEGFFREPRALSEVQAKLADHGWHYPQQNLSTPLVRLVRQRVLRRLQASDRGKRSLEILRNPSGKEVILMSENVKINIDLSTGTVQIECPETAFESTLNRVEQFLPKLQSFRAERMVNDAPKIPPQAESGRDAGRDGDGTKATRGQGKRRPTPVYKVTELGADDNAKREFKNFYESKKPQNQNDQVLLCGFWLNITLKRDTFTDDDVYTALRAAGAAKIPSRIESVISNLKLESKLVGEQGKYKTTHIGEDYVNNDLPPKTPKP